MVDTNNWIDRADKLTLDIRNFIDGQSVLVAGNQRLNKYSPRDGRLLYSLNCGAIDDVNNAVTNAKQRFDEGQWSQLPLQERKAILCKLADLIEANAEELALLESLDVGKPISAALAMDIPVAAAVIRNNAEAADKLFGKVQPSDNHCLSYQLRKPIGVVAAIVGWNFPLALAALKIGPALIMGNSLIVKPSEISSLSVSRVAQLAVEAGVPKGVFNVVHGAGAIVGSALATHQQVDLLTFTGSTQTGKQLLVASGESNMKRLSLECGGKAPNIIFEDCPEDLDAVADAVVARAFWNQGAVCTASTRLLVQQSIKDKLLPKLVERIEALQPTDPLNPDSAFGALISQQHMEKVLAYIDSGIEQGATLVTGGQQLMAEDGGFYVKPALFDQVNPQQKIAQEEIFGPVLSLLTFKDEEEAITLANNTLYGLSAVVWTQNLARAQRMAHQLVAGSIVIQATVNPSAGPAPGTLAVEGHRQSGFGKENGLEGLETYAVTSSVQFFT